MITDRRKSPRHAVSRIVRIEPGSNLPDYEGLVTNISAGGVRLFVQGLEVPDTFNLVFEDTHERRPCRVVWRIGPELGAAFLAQGARIAKGGGDLMAKKAKRTKRNAWTALDLRALKRHSRDKLPVAKISKLLKRTAGTLRQKARNLGLPLGHRP